MREIRTSGSEGGGANHSPYPYLSDTPPACVRVAHSRIEAHNAYRVVNLRIHATPMGVIHVGAPAHVKGSNMKSKIFQTKALMALGFLFALTTPASANLPSSVHPRCALCLVVSVILGKFTTEAQSSQARTEA